MPGCFRLTLIPRTPANTFMPTKTSKPRRPAGEPFTAREAAFINETLSGFSPDAPLWQALRLLCDATACHEAAFALAAGLTDSERHYCAGRAAHAADFWNVLDTARKGRITGITGHEPGG